MNIDCMFFRTSDDTGSTARPGKEDPHVQPVAVIELENSYGHEKIKYCLWKLLMLRCPVRLLACYQKSLDDEVALLRELTVTVRDSRLRPIMG